MLIWPFPDPTAIISGTVLSRKYAAFPGVVVCAPTVTILSPLDGTVIPKSHPVSITFNITGDQGPFTYTVSSNESVVATGVTISGTLTLDLGVLPPAGGRPEGHDLSVHAVNQYNLPGDAAG